MAAPAVAIRNLVGMPDGCTIDITRRQLDGHDIRFAERQRALGRGWQCIANQLRCNVVDIRRACGELAVERDGPAARAAAELTARDQVLLAIGKGATSAKAIRLASGLFADQVDAASRQLRSSGGLHQGRGDTCWRLTEKGEALLGAAMDRAERRGLGAHGG